MPKRDFFAGPDGCEIRLRAGSHSVPQPAAGETVQIADLDQFERGIRAAADAHMLLARTARITGEFQLPAPLVASVGSAAEVVV